MQRSATQHNADLILSCSTLARAIRGSVNVSVRVLCVCVRCDLRGTAVRWELTHRHTHQYNWGQGEPESKT